MVGYPIVKKGLAVGIILLFVGTGLIPVTAQNIEKSSLPTSKGDWLYVGGTGPGNYTRIQDAIDNATTGDTVFVYSGIYYENINIQKTIDVIGQNRNTTIIDGNETGTVVNVTADHVNLSRFTIQNSGQHGNPGGIAVEASYCTIVDNVITNNSFGIIFGSLSRDETQDVFAFNPRNQKGSSDSKDNTVLHNIVSNNGVGVFLYTDAPHNTIDGNTFLQNRAGVGMYPCSHHNILSKNTFLNDGLFVLNDTYSNVVVNNTVNGKPLLYLEGQSHKVITEDMGQIILVQCHNITVNKQEITNTSLGIELIDTTHCDISQNVIRSNNYVGIFLYQSSDNILMNNNIRANSFQGIFIWGKNNMIADNTITFNTEDGLHLYHSINNTIVGNNISNNNHDGIHIEVSESYNLISGNKIHQNKNCGMYFSSNSNNILLNNNITFNTNGGISADYCENILILNNIISHHNFGIQLLESSNNLLLDNTIVSNFNGIQLRRSSDNNKILDNNSISYNTCGINIDSSDSNTISNSNIIHNKAIGIELYGSFNNIISDNYISINREGIIVGFSTSDNILRENAIIENTGTGIDLMTDAIDNKIMDNMVYKNTLGINISGSLNAIYHNIISNNSYGINISYGSNNDIYCNNFLLNIKNAGFKVMFSDRYNKWNNNYWDRPRVLPQLILGKMRLKNQMFAIPWLNLDWHPAQEPYDIPG